MDLLKQFVKGGANLKKKRNYDIKQAWLRKKGCGQNIEGAGVVEEIKGVTKEICEVRKTIQKA